MDPQVAMNELLAALMAGDNTEALARINALNDWLDIGGFRPDSGEVRISGNISLGTRAKALELFRRLSK